MNTKQIAEEARKSLCRMFDECNRKAMGKHHTIYFPAPEAMDAIIQSAIEKARAIKTTEYAKGWDDHVAAVKAGFGEKSRIVKPASTRERAV